MLKSLRGNDEPMLHAVCSDLDVEFTTDDIIITAHNEATHILIEKHLDTLNKHAGSNIVILNKFKHEKSHNKTTDRLKELFGEKLLIEE